MRLLEKARTEDAEFQVAQHPCNLQRASPGGQRLVQLAEPRVDGRRERTHSPAATVVVQPLGDDLGFAQTRQHPPGFAEQVQHLRLLFIITPSASSTLNCRPA